jgi:DNA-binding NarL/FixJ family response regulator
MSGPTVSVIDDDRMLAEGLAVWLSQRTDLRMIHACASVDELLRSEPAHADVVLLDLALRDRTDPVRNVRRLIDAGRRVLVVTGVRYADRVRAAMDAGASGYVSKDRDLGTLASAIRHVVGGHVAGVPGLAALTGSTGARLAPREREFLIAYVSGMTMTAAARRIGVRPSTAKTYLERIKRKYADAGRPAYTKLDLAIRVREDGLGR